MQRFTATARAAIPLVAIVMAACSYSFKAGSGADGKPARSTSDAPASKPISPPTAEPEPAPTPTSEPTEDSEPTRTPPDEPPPVVEPQLTAVCRVDDESLAALCHRMFDPIAANDLETWSRQLGEGVVVTRPTYRKGMQRLQGPQAVREAAEGAGGLRELLHVRPTDRLVGTLSNDCRECRRAVVSFEVNTRSGTVVVTVDMTQPPVIATVEVTSHARRRHLEEVRQPGPKTRPTVTPTITPAPETRPPVTPTITPAPTAEKPAGTVVAPEPTAKPTGKPTAKKPALLETSRKKAPAQPE